MQPTDVLNYFGSRYRFSKETKMSGSSLSNWINWGFVPEGSQYKLERLTNGALKTQWSKKSD